MVWVQNPHNSPHSCTIDTELEPGLQGKSARALSHSDTMSARLLRTRLEVLDHVRERVGGCVY